MLLIACRTLIWVALVQMRGTPLPPSFSRVATTLSLWLPLRAQHV